MGQLERTSSEASRKGIHFSILIFFVGMLFTVTLWDSYYNGSRPFDQDVAAILILIMGTLFSISAGLFSWSIETRQVHLEKEVTRRTEELEEKNTELIQKNQEVENFIHIISHDLKAPIVSIQGFSSMIREELGEALKGSVLDYFDRIQANAKQMNALILDLLEFSRVGRAEDEKEEVNMKELVSEIFHELKPMIEGKNMKMSASDSLPVLWGSKKRVGQVFRNLIQNAVKYIGSPEHPQVEVGCEERGEGHFLIWVKDNGVGIKKEFQEKVFQIFQRAPNTQKIEGTGIGLSIVKKIVEHNGGSAWVDSGEGKGCQFYVTWPKANSNGNSAPTQKKAA
jgi:signal transduction histidine kinase